MTAGLPNVAVRVPDHPLTLSLLQQCGFPLAAPSANPFGYISPTTAQHVSAQLGDKIAYVLDGGACRTGLESTIIGFEGEQAVLHRLGGIPLEELEEVVGQPLKRHTLELHQPLSPGMLPFHYSPRTPLQLVSKLEDWLPRYRPERVGLISLNKQVEQVPEAQQIRLSEAGDLAEAGRRLYQSMHLLDAMGLEIILVEQLPDEGLGRTMNDRLRRAAYKTDQSSSR